jgi:hypothetical protein
VPLSGSLLGQLVLGALVGGVAAGMLCVLAAPARRWWAVVSTLSGMAVALVVVLVQATSVLSGEDAPDGFAADPRDLAGLSAVVVVIALTGWALGSAAVLGRIGAGVGPAVLAGALPSWLSALVFAVAVPSFSGVVWVGRAGIWLGAAVLGVALVTIGLRPPLRLVAWPLLVLLAWFTGPLFTAATYLEPLLRPGAGLPGTLGDSLAGAWQVFGAASSPSERDLLPWVVVLPVAVFVAYLAPAFADHRRMAAPGGGSADHSPVITEG